MKFLVCTLVHGEEHEKIAEITHPQMLAFARRCGAHFCALRPKNWMQGVSIPWAKFELWTLFESYDRIIFIDNDALVSDTCPNLFDIVPETHFGAFQEGYLVPRGAFLEAALRDYRLKTNRTYDGEYFNSGVMVVSKRHRSLFAWPSHTRDNMYEQSLLNARVFSFDVPVFALDYRFNRMCIMDAFTGTDRWDCHILHYAGSNDYAKVREDMVCQLENWRNKVPARTQFKILVNGGLGDHVCAEPVLRYMIEDLYGKDAQFYISAHFPRVFQHFRYPNVNVSDYGHAPQIKGPCLELNTHPPCGDVMRRFYPYQAVHNTDFVMLNLLRDSMPAEKKQIRLEFTPEELDELPHIPRNAVCIHAGVGWKSKTFPPDWWQEVVDGLARHMPVVLFGKSVNDEHGFQPVKCPDGAFDFRDRISMGAMFALINQCKYLLTNESSPVHVAGAFDNHIFLIATAKRPELLFPFRNGRVDYQTHAIYGPRGLTTDALKIRPNNPCKYSIGDVVGDIREYLPTPKQVVEKILHV